MGPGIALAFAHRGYEVKLVDINEKHLNKAKSLMRISLSTLVEFGAFKKEEIVPTVD